MINKQQENKYEKALYTLICVQHEYKAGRLPQNAMDMFQQDINWNWTTVPSNLVGQVLKNIQGGGNSTILEKVANTIKANKERDFDTEQQLYGLINVQIEYAKGTLNPEIIDRIEQETAWSWTSVPTTLVVEALLKIHKDGTASLTEFLTPKKKVKPIVRRK